MRASCPDALLLQRRLPQAVVQSTLADEIRHGLALGSGLGGDGLLLRRSNAQLDPRAAGVALRLHGFGLSVFAGFEGAQPLGQPRQGHRVSVCPQRVGWPSPLATDRLMILRSASRLRNKRGKSGLCGISA